MWRDAGVFLDIGHGAGSFAFETAEAALAAGIKPHAISTDMHQMSVAGPMFDLPTCLSKSLALGFGVRDVVAMATEAPARILRYEDRGTLRVGALADIALFRLHEGALPLYDNTGVMRIGQHLLRNVETIVGGRVLERSPASPRAIWRSTGTAVARMPACARFNASWWQGDIHQSRCAAVVQSLLGSQAVQLLAVSDARVAGRLTLVPKGARSVEHSIAQGSW